MKFNKDKEKIHPTQKPVSLLEYLIKTYTNENEVVLDNCMGSGSTGVACINTNRKFIGCELDENYFKTQLNTILTEFENIKYDKLLLATQIYSYCTYIGANYLILLNNMKALNIEINCLWGIYEQIVDQPIKINYSISNRYGFGVTYNPA